MILPRISREDVNRLQTSGWVIEKTETFLEPASSTDSGPVYSDSSPYTEVTLFKPKTRPDRCIETSSKTVTYGILAPFLFSITAVGGVVCCLTSCASEAEANKSHGEAKSSPDLATRMHAHRKTAKECDDYTHMADAVDKKSSSAMEAICLLNKSLFEWLRPCQAPLENYKHLIVNVPGHGPIHRLVTDQPTATTESDQAYLITGKA